MAQSVYGLLFQIIASCQASEQINHSVCFGQTDPALNHTTFLYDTCIGSRIVLNRGTNGKSN